MLCILCSQFTERVAVRPLTLHAHVAQPLALLCLQFSDLARLLAAKLTCLRSDPALAEALKSEVGSGVRAPVT